MSTSAFNSNKERNKGTMNFMMSPDNHPKHYDPLPRSRSGISSDAADIMQRNRGQMSSLMDHSVSGYVTSQRGPKVKGSAAEDNMRKSNGSVMASTMNVSENRGYQTSRPNPRVKAEAQGVAYRNAGTMNAILDNGKNSGYYTDRPQQRVRPEAGDNAVKNAGTMNSVLADNANRAYSTGRPQQRVKPEAAAIARKNRGQMNLVLSSESPLADNAALRVKPEAHQSYSKNRGTLTGDTYNYGCAKIDPLPNQKNKGDGCSNARHGVSGTVSNLFTQYGQQRQSARPASRVKSDGAKNARQGKGTIGDLLGTHGKAGRRSAMW